MGLISFFKEAGEKIFGGGKANAEELKKNLDELGLDTKDIQVEVDGDQVVLKGSAKDQETLEKAAAHGVEQAKIILELEGVK